MLEIIIGISTVLVAAAIIFFPKKSQKTQETKSRIEGAAVESEIYKNDKPQTDRATLSLEEKDHSVRPESNQQRNLDREVGGLEEGEKGVKEKKEEQEKIIEDAWDKRSDDVDKMGSFNPLAGSSKESMTWRLKKIRLGIGKHLHHDDEKTDAPSSHQGRLSLMRARQDFSHENDGGGMGR